MPYTTQYVDKGKGVLRVGTDIVTGAKIIAGANEDRRTVEHAGSLTYKLVDLTDVTELRISTAEVYRVVQENKMTAKYAPHVVVAVLATKDLPYGMARMWEILVGLATEWKTHIFREKAEMLAWLECEVAPHPPGCHTNSTTDPSAQGEIERTHSA